MKNISQLTELKSWVYVCLYSTLPILVVFSTSLEGTFLSSSLKASIMFSLGWPGSSRIDLYLSISSITTTLWNKYLDFHKNAINVWWAVQEYQDLLAGTLMLLVCNSSLVLVPVSPYLPLVHEQQIYPWFKLNTIQKGLNLH